jgi:hypothetical protein
LHVCDPFCDMLCKRVISTNYLWFVA